MYMDFLFSIDKDLEKFESRRSSGVEYFLGKEGVTGSIPVIGSNVNLLKSKLYIILT